MSLPIFQRTIVDSSGNIQPGASVAVRNETTGDLVPIFADREGSTAKANPFLADSEGFATFYVETGEYQVTATTPAGSITWSHVAIGDTALLELEKPTGSALVGFQQAGGVARTVEDELRERHFSAAQYGASVSAAPSVNLTAIQNAVNAAHNGGGDTVFIPVGVFEISGAIQAKNKVKLLGVEGATELRLQSGANSQMLLNPDQVADIPVDDFSMEGIIWNANTSGAELFAQSAVAVNGVRRFKAKGCVFENATGYGIGFQAKTTS